MSKADHPAVAAYKANKAQYDIDFFLGEIYRTTRGQYAGDCESLRERPEFVALMKTQVNPDPFGELLAGLPEMDAEDRGWLEAWLPGKVARRVIEYNLRLEDQQNAESSDEQSRPPRSRGLQG